MQKIPFHADWFRSDKERLPWETDISGEQVNLPDDFIFQQPRTPDAPGGARVGYFPDGFATYDKEFEAPSAWQGKQVFLHFDGAYMNAQVTFNEVNVALHPYGYTPFTVDLTPGLRFDIPNRISVSTHGNQPSSRWYSGAGLYRVVSLWVGEPCAIDPRDLFITTPVVERDRAQVKMQAQVSNTTGQEKTATVEGKLLLHGEVKAQASVEVSVKPGEKTPCTLELSLDQPALWDDLQPNLYEAVITVTAPDQEPDVTRQHVGIRKIEATAQEGLKINGRRLKLYGGCVHHDHGVLGARAFPRAEERKMENLKAAGFNAIRTAHNPPSEALLDACDRLGILVLDEFFDCWRTGKNRNDYHLWFEDWWQRDIQATVLRDRNHPSVYCWSFGNEIKEANGTSDGVYWVKAQADYIRSLDPTRLVTCGGMFLPKSMTCDGFPGGPGGPPTKASAYSTPQEQEENFRQMVAQLDVVSLNYSFRNYQQFHKLFPDKPLQGTETQGMDAWGNREAVRQCDFVLGDFMWTAHDNLGEAGAGRSYWDPQEGKGGLMAGYPWLSCFQGDLALDGERLPRSYYRKVIWGKDDGIYLFTTHPAHTGEPLYGTGFHWHDVLPCWTYPEQYAGKPIQVEAYCSCDEVEFFVNGVSQGKVVPQEMIASATVTYQPGELKAVAYREGKAAGEAVLTTTGPVTAIRLEPDRTRLAADGLDLSYVTITLVDSAGRRVYGEDRELAAFVNGSGTLVGFGSNNPCTEENFGTGRRFTWHGRAVAVVRAGDTAGEVELTVAAQGLSSQQISLQVTQE